jgi:hypothetical protein
MPKGGAFLRSAKFGFKHSQKGLVPKFSSPIANQCQPWPTMLSGLSDSQDMIASIGSCFGK